MENAQWQLDQFELHRPRLRAVAYRMLGSTSEADDAVQEAWLRLSRPRDGEIDNIGAWLTTVVGRVCLDMLRARQARRENLVGTSLPDPIVDPADSVDPEHEALLTDSVGLALLVVLGTLKPAERVAFVLHDMFGVPFEDIATLIDRSPEAARQIASRARRRVRAQPTTPDVDVDAQRAVINGFLAAAREGNFDALVAALDPNVVLHSDGGPALPGLTTEVHGALDVARQAAMWSRADLTMHPALVNGAAGAVVSRNGKLFAIAAVTVRNGKITEMDFLNDPDRLARLDMRMVDFPAAPDPSSPAAPRSR